MNCDAVRNILSSLSYSLSHYLYLFAVNKRIQALEKLFKYKYYTQLIRATHIVSKWCIYSEFNFGFGLF